MNMILLVFALVIALAGASTLPEQVIVGGEDVEDLRDVPYQCHVNVLFNYNWYFICGAVIYNHLTVVTAAHCIDGWPKDSLRIRCGDLDLYEKDGTEQTRLVDDTLPHPNYSDLTGEEQMKAGYPFDIGLVKVREQFCFNSRVRPGRFDWSQGDWPRRNCKLTGWGYNGTAYPSRLQWVPVNNICNEECNHIWNGDGLVATIRDDHICFYDDGEPRTACFGDSGGPATCKGVVVGITSWANTRCSGSHPVVYTRIGSYRLWLKENSFY